MGTTLDNHNAQYSIDVKDEIEAIIARTSPDWVADNGITLLISGPTISNAEEATIETIAASSSADRPSLTVVYTS